MIPIDHHNLGITIRIYRVISEPNLVPLPGRIHHKIIIQIEEETARVFIVNFSTTIGFLLGYNFSAILRDKFVLLGGCF
jgi:hypothetical protein